MGTVADVAAVLAATCSTPKVPTKSVVDWLIKNLGLAVAPGGPHGGPMGAPWGPHGGPMGLCLLGP